MLQKLLVLDASQQLRAGREARAAEIGHRWRNPVWHGPDGSFREW